MTDIKLEVHTVKSTGPLLCSCGAKIICIDDYGSIGCADECGYELRVEPVVLLLRGKDIKWVG